MGNDERWNHGYRLRLTQAVVTTLIGFMYVGTFLAVLGWAPGLALVGIGVLGNMTIHLVVGIVGYRHVMRRPWPKVEPLEDDDWW